MTSDLHAPTLGAIPARTRWLVGILILATLTGLFGVFGYLTAYGPHFSVVRSLIALYDYDEWTHCALVPFIVAFLVWWKRKELAALPVNPALIGAIPVAVGFAFFWVSYRLDDIYFAFISFQVLSFGLVVFFLGWRWMLALFFPWLFLGFAWPLFFLDNVIAFPLRIVMTHMSTTVLNVIGIPAINVGTSIQSAPNEIGPAGALFQVDVADPCSGMRSLFALTMVTALFGYFALKPWWKHALLIASAIPLAIAGNLVRILMLTVGILIIGSDVAIGTEQNPSFYHMLSGYVVFAVALAGMLGVASLLNGSAVTWIRKMKRLRSESLNRQPASRQSTDPLRSAEDIY